jgi:hypothetical protein
MLELKDSGAPPSSKDGLVHTGLPAPKGSRKVGELYTTYCGIVKPIERLFDTYKAADMVTCPTCLLKVASHSGT